MLKTIEGYLLLSDVVVFSYGFNQQQHASQAILHEFQRMRVVVVPAAADDDNCASAGSNPPCPSQKRIGGGGRC